MKQKRFVVKGVGIYHVFNRTAYARYTLNDGEREAFVNIMRKQAAFCGIDVLSYCVLSNHFHILVRVPNDRAITDQELMQRYRQLYQDDPAPKAAMRPCDLEAVLLENHDNAERLRTQLRRRMHRLSIFMKELQQRFGIWYNMTHGNKGTLWSERFRSVLVQNNPRIMQIVAAYIELNPVRAKIVERPEAFRWCSLSAALRGNVEAQAGIRIVTGHHSDYKRALENYTREIYVAGNGPSTSDPTSSTTSGEEIRRDQHSSVALTLRHRIAALTRGSVLGTAAFLRTFREKYAEYSGLRLRRNSSAATVLDELDAKLCSLRRCQ